MCYRSQASPHSDIRKFKHRVIVAGSRGFEDKVEFATGVKTYLESRGIERGEVIFISGDANSGADALIIEWCVLNDYPFALFPADWDDVSSDDAVVRYTKRGKAYNLLAGMWRNGDMAEVSNALLTFYDGVSKGTKDMMKRMSSLKHHVRCILINTT